MNRTTWKRFALLGGVAIAASGVTLLAVRARAAGAPAKGALTYTGYLEDPKGAALTGTHSISVRFWADETVKDALCTGELGDTELVSGRFQVPLPDSCADAVKANPDLFADVLVDGASLGRTKLGAVPFAIEAGHAVSADDAAPGGALETALSAAAPKSSIPQVTAWEACPADQCALTYCGVSPRPAVPNVNTVFVSRRVGEMLEFRATASFSGTPTSAGNGQFCWSLPKGISPVYLVPNTGLDEAVGSAYVFTAYTASETGGAAVLELYPSDASGIVVRARMGNGMLARDYPFTFKIADTIGVQGSIAVKGWTPSSP